LTMLLAVLVFSAAPADAYKEETVSDGGSVVGRVIFKGSPPERTIIPNKNKSVCDGMRKEALIEVGDDNGVKDAVVYLKSVESGKRWPAKRTYTLNNKKCAFEPHVQAMPVGDTLTILDSDPILHNTHGFIRGNTVFNVALPFKGAKVEKKINTAGLMHVKCDVHQWMRAWIYVADNPYYALSSEDGDFSIGDIPPGDYTVVIWQEGAETVEKPVTVKAGGKTDMGTIELKVRREEQ
jgi:plastocyanin